jgi:MSHA biogenesis protein MshL
MFKLKILPLLVATMFIQGCSFIPRAAEESGKQNPPALESVARPLVQNVVGLSEETDVETVEIGRENLFIAHPLTQSDPMPKINIPKMSIAGSRVYELIRALLVGQDISFEVSGDNNSVMRRTVSAVNISGDLEKILNDLSQSAGFYWHYKGGTLHASPDRQFIASIPPINEIFESLPTMVKTLGGTDVFLDKTSRTITYKADRPNSERIASYLDYIRFNKSMIVYDTYIWEVVLSDASNTGIQWNKFNWNGTVANNPISIGFAGNSVTAAPANSVGFSSVFSGARFSMDVLANFLQSQGTLSTISQPKIALISGGSASLRSGKTTYYVSGIGAPTISANGQSIAGATTTTPLQTGVKLTLSGDISESTIYTKINLAVTDLLSFVSYPAGQGQSLELPDIADREIHTNVRAQHNDTVLLAGVNYERINQDISGVPLPGGQRVAIPTNNAKSKSRSELVIVMRPRVIKFVQKPSDKADKAAEMKQAPAMPALGPMVPKSSAAPLAVPVAIPAAAPAAAPSMPVESASSAKPVATTSPEVKAEAKPVANLSVPAMTTKASEVKPDTKAVAPLQTMKTTEAAPLMPSANGASPPEVVSGAASASKVRPALHSEKQVQDKIEVKDAGKDVETKPAIKMNPGAEALPRLPSASGVVPLRQEALIG